MRNRNFFLFGFTLSALCIFNLHSEPHAKRKPASAYDSSAKNYTLEIKTLNIDTNAALKEAVGTELRATFKRKNEVMLARVDQNFLRHASNDEINIKIGIDPSWIENDQLEFKLELVKSGIIDRVIVRCAQVSKKLSEYNRSYQCFLPGEEAAFISYRLSDESKIKPSIARK
ncbi:hypothetical protein GW916_07410 [bacterium]|nr:hypothetical protein [bacterium]